MYCIVYTIYYIHLHLQAYPNTHGLSVLTHSPRVANCQIQMQILVAVSRVLLNRAASSLAAFSSSTNWCSPRFTFSQLAAFYPSSMPNQSTAEKIPAMKR